MSISGRKNTDSHALKAKELGYPARSVLSCRKSKRHEAAKRSSAGFGSLPGARRFLRLELWVREGIIAFT